MEAPRPAGTDGTCAVRGLSGVCELMICRGVVPQSVPVLFLAALRALFPSLRALTN